MDEHTLRVLEFDKILSMAAPFSVTAPGKDSVKSVRPLSSIDAIRLKSEMVSECRRMMCEGRHLGIEHFNDLSELFRKIKPADAVLRPIEIRAFLPLFYSSVNLRRLVNEPSCPRLGGIASGLVTHPGLIKAINSSIEKDGYILDNASPEMLRIRMGIKSCEKKIRSVLEDTLKKKETGNCLQDFFIAERNNRWVVPVKREFKSCLPGIVHDISNTGETVYVEPYSIQHIGNELESYRAEEKLEEYRILSGLSALLRENAAALKNDHDIVVEADVVQAAAAFAEQMDMNAPEINGRGRMRIEGGRHPLLWKTLKHRGSEKGIVPLDIEIGGERSCIVITGSNAGGKTVALKTIGIINLMALSGMHTPSGSGTSVPFPFNVFADIGDEQSIEQDLSTFSAHIKRISEIVHKIDMNSLVIIDELGTGTDPEQGGALSCAVLKKMVKLGAVTVVSSHLGTLKAFAHSEPGFTNAAMEMEEVMAGSGPAYRPTYRLVMGEAGTSYALEIARSLGMDEDIISDARGFMSGEGMRIEELIADLKDKNMQIEKKLRLTDRLMEDADKMKVSLEGELSSIKSSREETLRRALKEAEEAVRKTKSEADEIIREMRKSDLRKAREAAKTLDKMHSDIKEMLKPEGGRGLIGIEEIKEGTLVFINRMGMNGVVQSVNYKMKKCRVIVSGKEIMIPFSELSAPADKSRGGGEMEDVMSKPEFPVPSADISVPPELKVAGQRVDPALSEIERYLNDAAMAGLKQVKIIHGIGSGILSRAVDDFLRGHPLVESYRKGGEDEGGEGVTIVFI